MSRIEEVEHVRDALAVLRTACLAVRKTERESQAALTNRQEVACRCWESIYQLGHKRIAREIGEDLVAESTARSMSRGLTPRPKKGPSADVRLDPRQRSALAQLRQACERLAVAQRERDVALNTRYHAIREQWQVLAPVGAARIARAIGGDLVGESTIRSAVADLRRVGSEGLLNLVG